MKIDAALSPCPNDTFLFYGWIQGILGKEIPLSPHFADIEELNRWALAKKFPLIKISFATFPYLLQDYELLPVGAALGFHCGPKIIARSPFPLEQLPFKTIAIPGVHTTAHLLLKQLLLSTGEKSFCPYHKVASWIDDKTVDCGLIIHESRFTYLREGFVEIADLGELWHQKTGAPLPLGGLAIARSLPPPIKWKILSTLQESLSFAQRHIDQTLPFVLLHSQEKEPAAVLQHIETYVTRETSSLSDNGIRAIQLLLDCGPPEKWLLAGGT
jgi:1,4-dihydroxy-6-naphthoate synthase